MDNTSFFTTNSVSSNRIIYTPSTFARSSLIHLQETGTLQATHPHKNERNGLSSCLFFTVLRGSGKLTYDGETYALHSGDCVFIDCKKPYSHETGHVLSTSQDGELSTDTTVAVKISADEVGVVKNIMEDGGTVDSRSELWSLQWVHFYGPNMGAIYRKYQERGGKPVFQTSQLQSYHDILDELYTIASSPDYVRDMRIHEKLSSLLILLMEDAWDDTQISRGLGGRLSFLKFKNEEASDNLYFSFDLAITLPEFHDLSEWLFSIMLPPMQNSSMGFRSLEQEAKFQVRRSLQMRSNVFLVDAWQPERLAGIKFSWVFLDKYSYNAFKEFAKPAKLNTAMSMILIDPNEKIVLKEEWMNCPMKDDYSSLFLNPDDRTPGTNFYRKTDKLMRPLAAEVENDYEE